MSQRALWRSFAGGEITPELLGRIDITKYQTGLATCLNAVVLPHGPAARRPGFGFVQRARDSAHKVRLIPFAFSATQTVIIEFGYQYARFHINGQTLLESNIAVSAITGNQVTATAHGYSVGDGVYMGGRFLIVSQVVDANNFKVTDLWGAVVTPTGTTVARVYTIATPYVDTDLFDIHYVQKNDVLTLVHPSYPAQELRRLGAASWSLVAVSFTAPAAPGSPPSPVVTNPTVGKPVQQSYVYTYIGSDGVTESLPSPAGTDNNDLTIQGNFNTITLPAVTGATRYRVYKLRGGIYGYIGQTTGTSVVDDNILPDTTRAPPNGIYTLNDATGNYPAAVTYYEQRRWFAGTNNNPQNIWATRNATDNNLTNSFPSEDDDGILFRIASRQQNAIRHLIPLADLIALTVGGEFRIFAENAPSITPTSLTIKPQGYSGASNVQPIGTNNSVLYVQAQGSRVRELAYNWQSQAYTSIDISIMSPHLFNSYTMVEMAYVRAPIPQVWLVRSDGVLLCMTYVPEQQVYGWTQHTAGGGGVFESVAVVSEGFEDVLYAVVRRTINGQSVRYIERLHTRIFSAQADAFYTDSALTYNGASTTTISGLYHLEGQTVQVYANGAVFPTATVTGGSITLQAAATEVTIGLQYVTQLQTLPILVVGDPTFGEGLRKNVNKVRIRVNQSNLIKAGPSFSKLTAYPARSVTDNYGSPPALRTAELGFAVTPGWGSDGALCIQQDDPVPLTVLSVVLDYAFGG